MIMSAKTKEEEDYIVPERRDLFPIGGSQAITLPRDWIKFIERLEKKRLDGLYILADGVIVLAPEEHVEEFRMFLEMWSALTSNQKKLLIKLGRQYRETTWRTLTQRDIKNILKISPEIREYVLSEAESDQEMEVIV